MTVNEKAIGTDFEMRWANQQSLTRYWQEIGLARMKDDGLVPQEMTITEFVDWLGAGNHVALGQASFWNAQTGQVETFHNIPVNSVRVYVTKMDQANEGQPPLPMVPYARTRYTSDASDGWGHDGVYDPSAGTLWLVTEINPRNIYQYLKWPIGMFSQVFASVSRFVRWPLALMQANIGGTSAEGRTFIKPDLDLYLLFVDIWNRLFEPNYPLAVAVKK